MHTLSDEVDSSDEDDEQLYTLDETSRAKESKGTGRGADNVIYDKAGLEACLVQIKKKGGKAFTDTLALSYPIALDLEDPEHDLKREIALYRQALWAAQQGRKQCLKAGLAFDRPMDYFAEMVKSDEQMQKIRQRLLDEDAALKASEAARKQRDLKKFGKAVQVAKQLERQKSKKEMNERVNSMKRKRDGPDTTQGRDDDFAITLADPTDGGDRAAKKTKDGRSSRESKDKKYGFGGSKRHSKSNTRESTGGLDDLRLGQAKGRASAKRPGRPPSSSGKAKGKPTRRPGKSKRTAKR